MEYVTANLPVLLKMNPVVYGCKLQGFHTVPQFAVSQCNVVCSLTGVNRGVRQPKSHDNQIYREIFRGKGHLVKFVIKNPCDII